MTNVAARSVISLELDDTSLHMDLLEAQAITGEFFQRMQDAANITIHIDQDELARTGRHILRIPVDPATTTAGLEVISDIVKEYAGRLRREAHVAVGVDTQPVHTGLTRMRDFALHTARSIGDGIYFWISRGLLKAGRDMVMILPNFFKASFEKALEAEESSKKLAKALGATGEQAGKSHEELAAYARDLEKTTNISNETVQGVQALLAPSKGLSGINFDRATKGALDLAAALGGDINSHAERLAKSLQDPVRGIEQLRDAGISFTKEQQEIIKLFAETNRVGDAQGIMLDELESRYLGAADSTGDMTDKVKEAELSYENFKERIGEVVLDMKQEFIPAIDAAMEQLDEMTPIVAGAVTALSNMAIAVLNLKDATDDHAMSLDETTLKTSEWASALQAAYGGVEQMADNALTNLNDYTVKALGLINVIADQIAGGLIVTGGKIDTKAIEEDLFGKGREASEVDMFGSKERMRKRAEELEQAAIDRREKKKKQDQLDAEQRKADALKRKQDQEIEVALGTGLVTEAEIAKKGAKQALKDAKEQQKREHKELLAADRAAKKAARDQERADKKEVKEEAAAETKAEKAAKKAAREAEAAEKKAEREEEKAAAKAQADYEKSMGRDSLLALHERIQDGAMLRRKDLEEKEKEVTRTAAIENEFPSLIVDALAGPNRPSALGINAPSKKARERAELQQALIDDFMPNGRNAASALGKQAAPTKAQREAAERQKLMDEFGSVGGKGKIEVKQDEVVKAVGGTVEAIDRMSGNVVKAIKEPQKMGN